MAEEKKAKTCEEYVLNNLYKTEVELATTQKELQETKQALDIESSMHKELLDLVKKVFKGGRTEKTDSGLISVHLKKNYLGCYFPNDDYDKKEKEFLIAVQTLIEMVNAIPEREEE